MAEVMETVGETEAEQVTGLETEPETILETEQVDEIPTDEWYMLLVNKENPRPDDFTIELTEVDESGNKVDSRIIDDLKQMIEDGNRTGLQMMIGTSYRTIEYQQSIWDRRIEEYLEQGLTQEEAEVKAGESVMYPGCTDHHTGLGVDIISAANQMEEDFDETSEAHWLMENAWEYGFILRYPKDKEDITNAKYEPWHYRYVGKEQAKIIYESGLCLEEYLASIN